MSLINVSNLTFAYDGSYDNIFENVSFQLDTDWKLGFIGRNGKGKTTFLRLLLGEFRYQGKISSSVDFEYFPYKVTDENDLAVDIVEEICGSYELWQLKKELSQLGLSDEVLYRPFCTLSNGERTKILLCALFMKENSYLLIDEPTNHLDVQARKLVSEYLNSKHGFILVSHDRTFLDSCVDHVLAINRNDIEVQKGNFTSWKTNKDYRDSFEQAENEKLKKEIKHLNSAAKRTADWSDKAERSKIGFNPLNVEKSISRRSYEGAKAKKAMSRSKAIIQRQENALDEKSKLLKNIETVDSLKICPAEYFTDNIVRLENVTISYDDNTVCKGISFEVKQGERVALKGRNGCGKSSVIKLICGENIDYTGKLVKNNRLKISYVSQDTSQLSGGMSDYAEKMGIDESLFKAILRKLDFSRIQFEKNMEDLSGGQKKKVLIASSLCESANLYIWDEPLNFIDVFSRIQIEELLLKYKPTMLFVEHDNSFCDKISTKIVEI